MTARIVIVGAGPAGVRATQVLASAGLQPVLIDEAARIGGQIYRQAPGGNTRAGEEIYGSEASKAAAIHSCLEPLKGRFEYRPKTLVWNVFKRTLDLTSERGPEQLVFDRLLVATGAFDRVIPFPGWTLPGTFTLGAAQIALKSQGASIGDRVALVGTGPLLPLVASQYLQAGVKVAAVIDVTPFSAKLRALPKMMAMPSLVLRGMSYLRIIRKHGVPLIYGARAIHVHGTDATEGLSWVSAEGMTERIECDAVGASFGLRSETQLADLAGCEFIYDPMLRQWLPRKTAAGRTSVEGVYLAGDCAGISGADVAELMGARAAYAMQEDLGVAFDRSTVSSIERRLERFSRFRAGLEQAYPFPHHLIEGLREDTPVCRCEGISVGDLRSWQERAEPHDVNRQKAFTRIGMGRCQGRVCGLAAAELLARFGKHSIQSVGRLRGQPPIKPITLQGQ